MALLDIPEKKKKTTSTKYKDPLTQNVPNIKLKKGETLASLIETAKKIVAEKLGKYKDTSKCVIDINELKQFFNETEDIIGIDTETTGLNYFTDELVGISLCNGKQAIYIPVNHKSSLYNTRLKNQMDPTSLIELFKEETKNPNYKWVYHNAKFDLAVLRTFLGFNMPNPYWDTMIAACLFNQDEEHNLKYLYNKYIAVEDEGVNRFDTLFKGVTFNYIPLDVATIYAGKDAFMTYELYLYQKEKMDTADMQGIKYVFENIEMPLTPILVDMQRYGVNFNNSMLRELYNKYSARLEEAKIKVYAEIKPYEEDIQKYRITHYDKKLDDPISISSPSQLSILFYDIIKYKTKSGKGTGINELQEINTPLTKALIEYRKMEKLIDAFLVALPKRIEPSTGKIHTSLNQYGAATGRFSSSDPNLQQIPSRGEAKELRRLFGATKGYIMLSSDFSQQEPRVLAHMCGDQSLIETYRSGKDLYSTMAAQAFHTTYEDCLEFYLDENGKKTDKTNPEGKARRSKIKGVLLGILYGRGTASVAENINVPLEEAQQIIDDFFKAYPLIKQFTEETQARAKKLGYTTTAWGRRRYLQHIQDEKYEYHYNDKRPVDFNPLFTAKTVTEEEVSQEIKDYYNDQLEKANYYRKNKIIEEAKENGIDIVNNQGYIAEALRQCVNSTIQGGAADMSKRAMILIGQNEELKQLGFHMLFPVHDEIIAECPFEHRKRCGELLSKLMIQAGAEKISVPMKCDVEAFFFWYGPDVTMDDTPESLAQYNDYINTGLYKEENYYKNQEVNI